MRARPANPTTAASMGSAGTVDWAISSEIQEASRLLPSAMAQVLWRSELKGTVITTDAPTTVGSVAAV
jgi:hypothetical protein